MNLSDIPVESSACVVRVNGGGAVRQRLLDMGIGRGTYIRVLRCAPLRDPIEIYVKGYSLALRKTEAELIEVKPCPKGDGLGKD